MFTKLFAWFGGPFWSSIKAVWKIMWDAGYVTITWIVATITGVMVITEQVTTFMYNSLVQMAAAAGELSGALNTGTGGTTGALGSTFSIINVFFPLGEAFTLFSALSLVALASMTYRLIKSWIPTVA
jgi:hypothetical protein